jgi:hypothetical protein
LGEKGMLGRKVSFGVLIFLGFAVVAILYLVVMGGTADISGTIHVDTRLVSWEQNPPGLEEQEMISANGYCMKGPDADNRMLLPTKTKNKTDKLKYSFVAKEGMRHLLLIYLQMEHLTGDVGQEMELQFMTNIVKKGDMKRNFNIMFDKVNGIESIKITVTGTDNEATVVYEYPISEIPDVIKL